MLSLVPPQQSTLPPTAVGAEPRPGQADIASTLAAGIRDGLFEQLQRRLRASVAECSAAAPDLHGAIAVRRLQSRVLECADAMGEMKSLLDPQFARMVKLEQELATARLALQRLQAERSTLAAEERHSRHLALHDGLTSLPNGRYFRSRLAQALTPNSTAQRPLAVMYLDLDGFKPLNDAHGHPVGDELLKVIAGRLARTVRADDMVSRLGGDEFAFLMVGLSDRARLSELADRLGVIVSAPLKIGQVRCQIRPSIGIALCPEHGTTAEMLIRNADAAMYQAKRTGSGYAFCT
jgi:diguanylate cyclase (GGDEF)-like protein